MIKFKKNEVFDGKNKKYIQKLLSEIKKYENGNWSKAEFEELLNRPEVSVVYTDILVKYARPDSRKHQEGEANNYLKIFMREDRIKRGSKFISEYFKYLNEAENKYGVLKKDIVSIMMWESGLGEFTGNYRIFNVFLNQLIYLDVAEKYSVQLYVQKNGLSPYKSKAEEIKAKKRLERIKESAVSSLVALLRESRKKNIDPLLQLGSWGGAIGYVQFMPFNLKYVIDGDNNGTTDLYTYPDAIFSCANFLKTVGKYKSDEESRKKAIYRYNPSENYVKGVITYADTIWNRYLTEGAK